jgi:hypothetical protein
MNEPDPLHSLMPILMRFSSESATIRRLVIEDEGFCCLAEDYLLAHKTLQALKNQAAPKPDTIEEYTAILRDLEVEISKFLARARRENL